jgi:hypothetical protein
MQMKGNNMDNTTQQPLGYDESNGFPADAPAPCVKMSDALAIMLVALRTIKIASNCSASRETARVALARLGVTE